MPKWDIIALALIVSFHLNLQFTIYFCIRFSGIFASIMNAKLQIHISLLLVMVLVELQIHVKKSWTEKCLKDPTYAIFLKSWGFKDDKYDIPKYQSHSTRPQAIQLVPKMPKKLWTGNCLKDPTYAIFLKSWWFKDDKYDIPSCQSHSTRPQPIQLVPKPLDLPPEWPNNEIF